jgi:hypothetical protein
MSIKLLFSTLLILFSRQSISQIPISDNVDITWAAEFFSNCSIDKDRKEIKTQYIDCSNSVLKYIHQKGFNDISKSIDSFFCFRKIMIDLINDKKAVLYKNHFLETLVSLDELKDLKLNDSTISFSPVDFSEIMTPNLEKWQQKYILYFKIKQVIYYNSKTKTLHSIPIALAPIVRVKGKLYDLFWIPIDAKTKIKFEDKNIHWINRTSYNLFEVDAEILKEKDSFAAFWEDIYTDIDTSLQRNYYYINRRPFVSNLDLAEFPKEYLNNSTVLSVDSIITFDPETFAKIVHVDKREFRFAFFEGIKIYQNWAWNHKKRSLIINPSAFAPIYSKGLLNGQIEEFETPNSYLIRSTLK